MDSRCKSSVQNGGDGTIEITYYDIENITQNMNNTFGTDCTVFMPGNMDVYPIN